MKLSLTIAAVILALGFGLGWNTHQRLAAARALHETLSKGPGPTADGPAGPTATARRGRKDPEVRGKIVAADFHGYWRELMQALANRDYSGSPREAYERYSGKLSATLGRAKVLNPEELRVLIQELQSDQEIGTVQCGNFVESIIMEVADVRPEVALELLFSTNDPKVPDHPVRGYQIARCIRNLAASDPDAALKWLKENDGKVPADSKEEVKKSLLTGVAARDPSAAFRMLGGLGIEEPIQSGIFPIIRKCKTPEMRNAVMTGRSAFLATIPDEKKRRSMIVRIDASLGYEAAMEGFESGSKWIASAHLTEGGLTDLASKLGDNISSVDDGDIGKWVRWTSETLPADGVNESVRTMVGNWARADYRAAADWIRNTPVGPLKNTSTRAYAEAVSQYEPESAVEWAETLPAGSERDATLKTIHNNWLKKDPGGAADFASKYGIK